MRPARREPSLPPSSLRRMLILPAPLLECPGAYTRSVAPPGAVPSSAHPNLRRSDSRARGCVRARRGCGAAGAAVQRAARQHLEGEGQEGQGQRDSRDRRAPAVPRAGQPRPRGRLPDEGRQADSRSHGRRLRSARRRRTAEGGNLRARGRERPDSAGGAPGTEHDARGAEHGRGSAQPDLHHLPRYLPHRSVRLAPDAESARRPARPHHRARGSLRRDDARDVSDRRHAVASHADHRGVPGEVLVLGTPRSHQRSRSGGADVRVVLSGTRRHAHLRRPEGSNWQCDGDGHRIPIVASRRR